MERGLGLAGVVVLAIAACNPIFGIDSLRASRDDDDGAGGVTAAGSVSTGSGGMAGAIATPQSSAAAGGAAPCDTGQPGRYDTSREPCYSCVVCAVRDACSAEAADCPVLTSGRFDPNDPCDLFWQCLLDCESSCDLNMNGELENGEVDCYSSCSGDSDNPQACVSQFPDGSIEYAALVYCLLCEECPLNCDGVSQCL